MRDIRHFLDLDRLDSETLRSILDEASSLKKPGKPKGATSFAGRVLALVFERPSTRTRISFQVAMQQLGGHAVLLSQEDSQLGRGESMADTARVLSRYADVIAIRAETRDTS